MIARGRRGKNVKGVLIHLLHRFDLRDPAIPIVIPGVRWLPLYYCFDFCANQLAYRLISDDAPITFFPADDPNVTEHESWPGEDFPLEFPKSTIKITEYDYDPTDLEGAYAWAGIFGIGKLSKANRAVLKRRIAEEWELDPGDLGFETEFEEALSSPFVQCKPPPYLSESGVPEQQRNWHCRYDRAYACGAGEGGSHVRSLG